MHLQQLLANTEFADEADCIASTFERARLTTYERWQNAPVKVGTSVCGEDIYSVVAALNKAHNVEPDEVPELVEEPQEQPGADDSIFALTRRGVSEEHARALASGGYMTLAQAQEASDEELATFLKGIDNVGEKTAEKIIAAIRR